MDKIQHFILMNGYAQYVWPAYGAAFFILIGNFIAACQQRREVMKKIRRRLQIN